MSTAKFINLFLLFVIIIGLCECKKHNNGANKYQKYLKRSSAATRLVVRAPIAGSTLISNTTSTIHITNTAQLNLNKSMKVTVSTTQIRTNFTCDGVVIASVVSILDERLDFHVSPELIGNCSLVAEAIYDTQYEPSVPVFVNFIVPLYFESVFDNVLYSGEQIDFFLRASNDAPLTINVGISCDNDVTKTITVPTNQDLRYTVPIDLFGHCEISTPNVPENYAQIQTIQVEIEPVITFTEPSQNQVYIAGSTIHAKLNATNSRNPQVTVELTCMNTVAGHLVGDLNTVFSFQPNPRIYGDCVLSVSTLEPYYTEDTVNIKALSTLTFIMPIRGASIANNQTTTVQVNGSAGDTATVVMNCSQGGSFSRIVTLGVPIDIFIDPIFSGICFLTATAEVPYFSIATTFINVYPSLRPDIITRAARTLILHGRILSLTKPFNIDESDLELEL